MKYEFKRGEVLEAAAIGLSVLAMLATRVAHPKGSSAVWLPSYNSQDSPT